MDRRPVVLAIIAPIGAAMWLGPVGVLAQQATSTEPELRRIAVKNGESVELASVYWQSNCRSTVIGTPQVEILEGPPEIEMSIKESMVVPRAQGCTQPIPGGKLFVTAKDIKETRITRLIYRIKFKTKDGDRQTANAYYVGLVP
jgi:hypothetical protein